MPKARETKVVNGVIHLQCKDCRGWLPEDDFHAMGKYRRSYCRQCQAKRSAIWWKSHALSGKTRQALHRRVEEAEYLAAFERMQQQAKDLGVHVRNLLVTVFEEWLELQAALESEDKSQQETEVPA